MGIGDWGLGFGGLGVGGRAPHPKNQNQQPKHKKIFKKKKKF